MGSSPPSASMLHVFLNYACQAKCAFCYNPPLTSELIRWELSLPELARQLFQGRRDGYDGVTFSGGEITLMRELPKILRLARKAQYACVGIISNGVRLADREYAGQLRRAGLDFCCLSLHAAEPALHDRIVEVPGAFARVLEAIEGLRSEGVRLLLNFVMVRANASQAAELVRRFAGVSEIVEFQLYYPHYEGLMERAPEDYGLSMREAALEFVRARAAARAAGIDEKVWYYNMPPCAVPALADRLRNWERESDRLVDPAGLREGAFLPSLERKDRIKQPACARCSFEKRCLGFERGYAARFGDEGFAPLEGPFAP